MEVRIMLNPKVDLAFKKLFGVEENKDILMSFINSVVSEKDQVKDIILKNPYNEKNFINDKLSILDVKAQEAITGKWYNLEMQLSNQDFYAKRALYYWSKLYMGQLESGVIYSKLEKTICINILNFKCIDDEEDYHNVYKIYNEKSKKLFFDDLEIHFIELTKYHKKAKNLLDKWITFLKHENISDEIESELEEIPTIKKAVKVLEQMNLSKEERETYEARLGWLWDEELSLRKAKRIGREQGLEEGREEGLEKGRVEGVKKEKKETIKSALEMGIDIKAISILTKLSIIEVEAIVEELNNGK